MGRKMKGLVLRGVVAAGSLGEALSAHGKSSVDFK